MVFLVYYLLISLIFVVGKTLETKFFNTKFFNNPKIFGG